MAGEKNAGGHGPRSSVVLGCAIKLALALALVLAGAAALWLSLFLMMGC